MRSTTLYEEGDSQRGRVRHRQGTVALSPPRWPDRRHEDQDAAATLVFAAPPPCRGSEGARREPEHVAIKLYRMPTRVGPDLVNDRCGARLRAGAGASGFTTARHGRGARFAAVRLRSRRASAARIMLRCAIACRAQNVGRQIVTEQRAFRRAIPALTINRGQPARSASG